MLQKTESHNKAFVIRLLQLKIEINSYIEIGGQR